MKFKVEITFGELVDRQSILNLKCKHLQASDPEWGKSPLSLSLAKQREFYLNLLAESGYLMDSAIIPLGVELQEIHKKLWDIENAARVLAVKADNSRTIESTIKVIDAMAVLYLQVILHNNRRAEIKQELDRLTGEDAHDPKFYGEQKSE